MSIRGLVALAWALLGVMHAAAAEPEDPAARAGEAIYLTGVLPSGAPLEGTQSRVGVQVTGARAACVNCHQRSGLGTHEGSSLIPAVTKEQLFAPRMPEGQGMPAGPRSPHGRRPAYTDETLARAIRAGLDPEGHPLDDLMPRFALDDASMAALLAYLRQLTVRHSVGLSGGLLHIATIVTADADPTKRQGVLDVLKRYVTEKNASPIKSMPLAHMGASAHSGDMLVNRHWQLQVWTLSGSPSTWRSQLERDYAAQPVFAVISGAGRAHWAPVHEFCEQHAVPCLLPYVEVPVVAEQDFYPVYFSRGVLLEAELFAQAIVTAAAQHPASVRQVYRRGDSGEPAAAALAAALRAKGIPVTSTVLPAAVAGHGLDETLAKVPAAAIQVLWLRAPDVAALAHVKAPHTRVYLSGTMAGLENAPVPPTWRAHLAMSYPFELPQRRGVQLDYPLGWFAFRHVPVLDRQAQSDTFLACSLLADTLNLMDDHASPAYLVERLQALLERRTVTGYYPRLTLASGQRFASKGGYLVHFAAPTGTALIADTPWTVP